LPTAWQSAKLGSRQILFCRLQEIPVGKGTSLPSVEKKQLAKKIAVGKEPVSCSEWGKTYAPLDLIASYYWHLEFKLRAQDCVKHAVSFSDVPH
jgi:hypothetical protein